MHANSIIGLALTLAFAQASVMPTVPSMNRIMKRTLDPASSNSEGKKPKNISCSASKSSSDIQAAECSHNTRTSTTQTFAVFVTDHSKDDNHGAPYGTCSAYTCDVPTEFEADADYWTFFWDSSGESSGYGTDCIKDPETGECGCEDSDGTFISGSSSCT